MGRMIITLPDECQSRLEQRAAELGITVEELVKMSLDELLAKTDEAFDQAVNRVMEKNKDLYERLGRYREFGSANGLIDMADDFDAPLHDFAEHMS